MLIFIIISIILVCFNKAVTSGVSNGLIIWSKHLVPAILPFMFISSYFLKMSNNRSPLKKIVFILISCFTCGCPSSIFILSEFYRKKEINKKTVAVLLPFTANFSPLFYLSYISHLIPMKMSPPKLLLIFYISELIVSAATFFLLPENEIDNPIINANGPQLHASNKNITTSNQILNTKTSVKFNLFDSLIIENCITQITIIGMYVVIFSVIQSILLSISDSFVVRIIAAAMEVTTGSLLISGINPDVLSVKKITALIISITAFGGFSSSYQAKTFIDKSGLSFYKYLSLKILIGLISYTLSILLI